MEKSMSYTGKAQLGESLRLSGNYSAAIMRFTEAIQESPKKYSWAYAHRAAARSGLGDYAGALDDFQMAYDFYSQRGIGWLLAQIGELCRLWARASFTLPATVPTDDEEKNLRSLMGALQVPTDDPSPFNAARFPDEGNRPESFQLALFLMDCAIGCFAKALDLRDGNAWVHAHIAATYTMRCWIGVPLQRQFGKQSVPLHDFEQGDWHFKRACNFNPAYGWAYAFHAVLLGLRQSETAVQLIGKAYLSGMDRQVPLMRTLTNLYLVNKSRTTVDQQPHEEAVQSAWSLLREESDEVYARYYVADGLKHSPAGTLDRRTLEAAINRARVEVLGMRGRTLAMQGGLACMQERYGEAAKMLEEIRSLQEVTMCDLETLSMLSFDPAWSRVREPGTDVDANPALQRAHEEFVKLFMLSPVDQASTRRPSGETP